MIRKQGTDNEEDQAEGTGPGLQDREENEPHHGCAGREIKQERRFALRAGIQSGTQERSKYGTES